MTFKDIKGYMASVDRDVKHDIRIDVLGTSLTFVAIIGVHCKCKTLKYKVATAEKITLSSAT